MGPRFASILDSPRSGVVVVSGVALSIRGDTARRIARTEQSSPRVVIAVGRSRDVTCDYFARLGESRAAAEDKSAVSRIHIVQPMGGQSFGTPMHNQDAGDY